MNIVFRTDSSFNIGSGHLMRCLTLADQLRARGGSVSFISRETIGNLCHLAEEKGYTVHRLAAPVDRTIEQPDDSAHLGGIDVDWQADAEETKTILRQDIQSVAWLIVDHYALDKRWDSAMRPFAKHIMVIDDLADRPHDCDLLLDQNLYANMDIRYKNLVPPQCIKLLGPSYVLLRQEFMEQRKKLRKRDGSAHRILICFGGTDKTNETAKTLNAILSLNREDIAVDVVIGIANPHSEELQRACALRPDTTMYRQTNNMAALMVHADLSIGAGGTMTWERCFLGLPSIILVLAANQAESSDAVARAGAAWNLGWHVDVNSEQLAEAIAHALDQPLALLAMTNKALSLTQTPLSEEESAAGIIYGF